MSVYYAEPAPGRIPSLEQALAETLALAEFLASRLPADADIPEPAVSIYIDCTEGGLLRGVYARTEENQT